MIDEVDKERPWVVTTPRKIVSRKLVDEIVTYAGFQTLGIQMQCYLSFVLEVDP